MEAVSQLGDSPWTVGIFVLAITVPLLLRRWNDALLLALTPTGDALALAVKFAVARPRPTADVVTIYQQVAGYSFPSGHVVHYVVFYGVIGYFAWGGLRDVPRDQHGTRVTLWLLLGVSGALIALVSVSRVYLGAHWPSDVVGGYLLGGAWLVTLLLLHARWPTTGSYRRLWGASASP